jgi:hypothetical protein
MSLPAWFYRCPPELNLNLQDKSLVFTLCAYSEYQHYKLIWWHFGAKDDLYGLDGQLLYDNTTLIGWASGGVLFNVDSPDNTADSLSKLSELRNKSPWDRVNSSAGSCGLPNSIAIALLDKRNYRLLTSDYL